MLISLRTVTDLSAQTEKIGDELRLDNFSILVLVTIVFM